MRAVHFLREAMLVLVLVLAGCTSAATVAEERPSGGPAARPVVAAWKPAACPDDQVNFLVMGDWGADTDRQRQVAAKLGDYAASHRPAFNALLTVGDNLPARLKSVDDMNWQKLFEDMYDARKLNIPFYITLGNHDYDDGKNRWEREYVAKHPDSRFKQPAMWYRLDLPMDRPLVTVLMLNSNREKLGKEEWASQRRWIDQELSKPRQSKWLMVCAHHPLFNNGNHGDDARLQKEWGELFKKHAVDFYFCGHDHTLQHLRLKDWPTNFVVVGGGGQKRMPIYRNDRGPFGRSLYGFAHVKFTADSANISLIDGLTGQAVHQFTEDLQRRMSIVKTTPNDKPIAAAKQAGASKPNTPAHRAIKAEGDNYKRMASVLSFAGNERAAFDKAVGAVEQSEEARLGHVLAVLSLKQLQRWGGYVLYARIVDEFSDILLSDEQHQQAFAVCVAMASQSVDAQVAQDDPTLEPDDQLQDRAIAVIHDHVLTTAQRKQMADAAALEEQQTQTQPAGK